MTSELVMISFLQKLWVARLALARLAIAWLAVSRCLVARLAASSLSLSRRGVALAQRGVALLRRGVVLSRRGVVQLAAAMFRLPRHALALPMKALAVPRRAFELVGEHRASLRWLAHRSVPVFAIALLIASMGGTWRIAGAAPPALTELEADSEPQRPIKKSAKELTGKVNINTATEDQLMMLPTIGPAKADRIVLWRKKNGGFKRIADLRRVKGFGYKTFKRLEPFLDIKGETTLK